MRKYWKWILSILALLLVGLLIWFIFFYRSTPHLSDQEKDKIEEVYNNTWFLGSEYVKTRPIVWYDENGGIEEDGVWRYVGTYGDCYAFLKIGDNFSDMTVYPPYTMPNPFPLDGLSHEVYYHTEANVVLYHTKKDFTILVGDREYSGRLKDLREIDNREEWITDEQLERLTRDVEKIAAAHN